MRQAFLYAKNHLAGEASSTTKDPFKKDFSGPS